MVLEHPEAARAACDEARRRGDRVGFVPTMGALHEGHLSLVREARRHASFVVCSIFVNPTQFGPNEDFTRYPRNLEADVKLLAGVGANAVFAPQTSAMYVDGERTRVRVDELTSVLEGPHRPGHFEGVTTIVTKLFAIVGPSVAVFGKKDYQQLAVIRRMTKDLFLPVEIMGHPIVRDPDGLAMSSRNTYLSAEERERALSLSRGLDAAWRSFSTGERSGERLRSAARAVIEPAATTIDYVEVADADTLVPFADGARVGARALVAVAARIGKTRLIDNVVLGEDPSPLAGVA